MKMNFFIPARRERRIFISFIFTCVSLPSLCGCLVRAGLVLTGSWWGVRRDANSHNLSLGADRLVARKFIQRVLSLHLPYFEVALSTLACRTWLCVHFSPPSSLRRVRKTQRWSTHACRYTCMRFSTWCAFLSGVCSSVRVCVCVCFRGVICVHVCVCVCVFERQWEWKGESRRGRREGERGREGEMLCANPYSLWRIQGHPFMFCQPSVNQFPIKVVLNSAVIPISSSRFRLTVSEHFPCLPSDLLQCVRHVLPGQTRSVKLSNNTS